MKYNGSNLKEVLEAHKRWLIEDAGFTEDDRANLRGANLSGADLIGSNLIVSNLSGAVLSGAVLNRANLSGANNIPDLPMSCPDCGEFIGWKKARRSTDGCICIVKLLIPADARRSSGTGRKCRCDKATVLEIQDMNGNVLTDCFARSDYNRLFEYHVDFTVTADEFDMCRWNECSKGIHFFINRMEAVNYNL